MKPDKTTIALMAAIILSCGAYCSTTRPRYEQAVKDARDLWNEVDKQTRER